MAILVAHSRRSTQQERGRVQLLSEPELLQVIAAEAIASTMALAAISHFAVPCLRQGRDIPLSELTSHLHFSPALLAGARQRGRGWASTVLFQCMRYRDALARAMAAGSRAYDPAVQSARSVEMVAALGLWESAVDAGLRLLDELRHDVPGLAKSTALALSAASAALVSARNLPGGDVTSLTNRRRSKRTTVNAAATLVVGMKSYRIVVVDMSSGGLGLANVVGVQRGDRVICRLDQREYSGSIAWLSGTNAGLVLDNSGASVKLTNHQGSVA